MGHSDAARLLKETLDEEKSADAKLSSLAEGGINQDAAEIAHPSDEEEEDEDAAPARGGRGGRSAIAVAKRPARR
jgi:hypothetical protein